MPSLSCFRLRDYAYELVGEGREDEVVKLDDPYELTLRATDLTAPH